MQLYQSAVMLNQDVIDHTGCLSLFASLHGQSHLFHPLVGLFGLRLIAEPQVNIARQAMLRMRIEIGHPYSLQHQERDGRSLRIDLSQPVEQGTMLPVHPLQRIHLHGPAEQLPPRRHTGGGQEADTIIDNALHGLFPGQAMDLFPFLLIQRETGGAIFLTVPQSLPEQEHKGLL